MRRRVVIDRATAAALVAGIVVLDLLIFSAGWLVGGVLAPPTPLRPNREPAVVAFTGSAGVPPALTKEPTELSPLADIAAFTPPPKPAARPVPRKVSLDVIHEAALSHALPPALVEAVARVESGLNPRALSPKGARGLMQVMPATGRRFGIKSDRLFEPEHNLAAGVAYLSWLMKRYDDNLDFVLAAYNAGEGAVDDYGGIPPYRETQDYVRRVRAALRKIEARESPPEVRAPEIAAIPDVELSLEPR